jgi:ribosomal protein L11 methyltransferase
MAQKPEDRWLEISVEVERDAVDDLVSLLGRYCTGGAVVEDRPAPISQHPNSRATVKGFLPVWDQETRLKLEVALLLLSKVSPISVPRFTILEPEDWAESWKAYFPPQHIGQHTVIVPTWIEYRPKPGEVILRLDPGMAFGTGLHATTRLCLAAIESLIRPGIRVLDVGTGSGILSIAAALQGAGHVEALDIDTVAVEVARQNAGYNGVAPLVHVSKGTLPTGGNALADVPLHEGTGYDLLLVNIFAETIIGMAPAMGQALCPAGQYVATGIIQEKAADVVLALQRAGLTVDQRLEEEDWVALVGRRI